MANFIGLVYATLKKEGVDTSGMDTDEAVAKYNELQKKSGGKAGEKEPTPAEQKRLKEKGIDTKTNNETNQSNPRLETAKNSERIKKINAPIDKENAELAKIYEGDKGFYQRFKHELETNPEFVEEIKRIFGGKK